MAIEMKGEKKRRALRLVGIREAARLTGCSVAHVWYIRRGEREIARLTGYSPAHVCYASRGMRISRPLRAKMRELGLKFKEGK